MNKFIITALTAALCSAASVYAQDSDTVYKDYKRYGMGEGLYVGVKSGIGLDYKNFEFDKLIERPIALGVNVGSRTGDWTVQLGLDGNTLTKSGERVYYGTLTGSIAHDYSINDNSYITAGLKLSSDIGYTLNYLGANVALSHNLNERLTLTGSLDAGVIATGIIREYAYTPKISPSVSVAYSVSNNATVDLAIGYNYYMDTRDSDGKVVSSTPFIEKEGNVSVKAEIRYSF